MSKEYLLAHNNASDSQNTRHLNNHHNLSKSKVALLPETRNNMEPARRQSRSQGFVNHLHGIKVIQDRGVGETKIDTHFMHKPLH